VLNATFDYLYVFMCLIDSSFFITVRMACSVPVLSDSTTEFPSRLIKQINTKALQMP
jgi:hypothetical protein